LAAPTQLSSISKKKKTGTRHYWDHNAAMHSLISYWRTPQLLLTAAAPPMCIANSPVINPTWNLVHDTTGIITVNMTETPCIPGFARLPIDI
jgi:hypothetical protein